MTDPFFFGYGSLVNRRTHAYPNATPARVMGWRRVWRGTTLREVAFLTVEPDPAPEADIAGLIAAVPGADWAALDERERAYRRHRVARFRPNHTAPGSIEIYAIEPKLIEAGDHPILLSYLDTVVQGILDEFGEPAAREFFVSTRGWKRPVLDDRSDPIYPRATLLSPSEQSIVDTNLARVKTMPP